MENVSKENLSDRNIWVRVVYMIILVIAYAVAETLIALVSLFQFLCALVTGEVNQALHQFGANLSAYIAHILKFATFNTEELPFPFSDWPDTETGDTPWSPTDGQASDSPVKESSVNESSVNETPTGTTTKVETNEEDSIGVTDTSAAEGNSIEADEPPKS